MKGEGFKIRFRQVIKRGNQYGQQYGRYDEYQVVSRGKIVGRFDMLPQAQREYPGAELDASIHAEAAIRKASK